MKRILLLASIVVLALLVVIVRKMDSNQTPTKINPTPEVIAETTSTPQPTVEATISPDVFTDINSLLIVANKKHRLPEGYEPADLVDINKLGAVGTIAPYMRKEAAEAVAEMTKAAKADGVSLMISSAYRSEDYQSSLYYGYVNQYGAATADTISSRPGYSDHQTGLACDFVEGGSSDFNAGFESTASGQWLANHAHEYGFIIRYPKGKDAITGYTYEPWHFRYVGKDYAKQIFDSGLSFEEFFNVEGGDYAQ